MRAARLGTRDLRLVPPAVLAWLGAGIAIGVRDAGTTMAVVAVGLWVAAALAVAVAIGLSRGEHRARWPATVAVGLVAVALTVTAVAASAERREPEVVLAASEAGRSAPIVVAVTGRPIDGRVEGTIVQFGGTAGLGSPALVFGAPGDPLVAHTRIGELITLTGGVQRADPGEDVAFLVFARDGAAPVADPPPCT